jgi:hypothetical protein
MIMRGSAALLYRCDDFETMSPAMGAAAPVY